MLWCSFRARFAPGCGPYTFARFLKCVEGYLRGVGREAELRTHDVVLDVECFNAIRRDNSGVGCCLGLLGYLFDSDLPDSIYEHPVMMRLRLGAIDMVCWSNVCISFIVSEKEDFILTIESHHKDVYSYNMEQSRGIGGNNIVTVLMAAYHVDLQSASDLVGQHFKYLMGKFIEGKKNLPSWGLEVDTAVGAYVQAMEHWVIGNLDWSFETQRYFGAQNAEIKRTLIVNFLPKRLIEE